LRAGSPIRPSISTRSGLRGLSDPSGYLRPARCAHSCARCAQWLSARGAGSAIQTNHMVPNRICIGFFKASQFAIPLQDAVRIMSAVQDIGRLMLFEHGHFHLTAPAMQHLHHQERSASAASAGYLPDTIRHLRVPCCGRWMREGPSGLRLGRRPISSITSDTRCGREVPQLTG
jgi:hypothetical protein